MATLPIQVSTPGAALDVDAASQAAAAGGDDFPNDGHTLVYINNGGTGAITLTIDSIPNKTYNIVNAKWYILGPFPKNDYDDTTGHVRLSYSGVTTVKVAAVRSLG